jgi:uncharacterized iron-regulated membrane protein
MPSRRTVFAWHSWIGLTCGLLLFVVCWSGTIAVFSHEIDWLLNPALRANAATAPVDWQAAYEAVRAAHPNWTITEISAPRYSGFAIEVIAQPQPEQSFRVYVDPVGYQVLGDTSFFNVQRFFRSFHMALFDTDGGQMTLMGVPLGYFIVGLMGGPLLVSIVTPLVFYKRWWRGFWRLERRKSTKIFWSSLHKFMGVWSMLVGLVIAVTGIWYLAEWWTPMPSYFEPGSQINAPYRPLNDLVAGAERASPALVIRMVSVPDGNDGLFQAVGQDGTVLVRDSASVTLDAATGAVLDRTSPSDVGLYLRWIDTADPLHFGDFGGLWMQSFYFLVGLCLSVLALTGAYLQVQRQKRRNGEQSTRRPVVIAYALTSCLLLYATFSGVSEIRAYGLDGNWPDVGRPTVAVIALWCASTLLALTLWMRKVR